MPQAYLHSDIGHFKTTVDTSQIRGNNGYFYSIIKVPFSLVLEPRTVNNQNTKYGRLLGIEAKLSYKDNQLSLATSFQNKSLYTNNENTVYLDFPIDQLRLRKLEDIREKDVTLKIHINLTFALYEELKIEVKSTITICSKFERADGELDLVIPQSNWLKVLSSLGYRAFEMIEVPSINDMIGEEYVLSMNELREANQYLHRGEYDKVVAHCRSALEPSRKRFPNLKNKVKAGLPTEWLEVANSATLEWLDKIFRFQADITNKTHHVPSIGHYSKREAEAIYMLTVATISMAGQIEPL